MGGEFLTVDIVEEGAEGSGGYAKEMSKAFIDAEMALFRDQCKEVDIIISTALIPGKPAPKLILDDMVQMLKPGSVTVDLAAEMGGNIATTVKNQRVVTPNGVICLGYTDFPSRLPTQASNLYANNQSKFLLSMTPEKQKGRFYINENDDVVRSFMVQREGTLTWPAPPPKTPQAAAPPSSKAKHKVLSAQEMQEEQDRLNPRQAFMRRSLYLTAGYGSLLGLGFASNTPAFSTMVNTLALSTIAGYYTVWGVAPALHSPLMSVTNAISGITAIGGMYLMGGGLFPQTTVQALGAGALLISAVNIGGGFLVTKRMLDLFKRPTDPPEYNSLYLLPASALLGGYAAGKGMGYEGVQDMTYLAASIACIGGVAGLSTQKTARLGNVLGMTGVSAGLAATVGLLSPSPEVLAQMALCGGLGGGAGLLIGSRVGPSELPQTVAAFHSLVGLAAVTTSIGSYMHDPSHAIAALAGTAIGAITFTGSLVAFGKLQGSISSAALNLPGKNLINLAGLAGNIAALGVVATTKDPNMGLAALGASSALAGGLGLHLVYSIGGADAPVAVTLLNSYSGWALCAEGFMLNNSMMTTVGALIGSSGAILSLIVS